MKKPQTWNSTVLLLGLALVAIGVAGCSTESSSGPADTVETLKSVDANESAHLTTDESEAVSDSESEVFVIDVRSKEEWDTGHVEQASHIPHTDIVDRIAEVTDDKSASIMLYCAAGGRAGKAKKALEDIGFTNVENGGGYDDVKERFEQNSQK